MKRDSRAEMISSAAELIGAKGMTGTSFTDVLEHSGAPRGSIYHHFPGGKEELAKAAVIHMSDVVIEHQGACKAETAQGVIEHFVALFRTVVETSCATAGCPAVGIAVDSGASDQMMPVVRDIFREWAELIANQLRRTGLSESRARSTASATVAGVEGALIMCRAEGTAQPLEEIERILVRSLT